MVGTFLKKVKRAIRYVFRFIRRKVAKVVCRIISMLIPKNGIVIAFDSMKGEQYSCNPRAIYEYMLKTYPSQKIKYVWAFREPEKFIGFFDDPNTVVCERSSVKHIVYCCMADVIIFNFVLPLSERKNQIRLQTWHGGGCYKKIGLGMNYNSGVRNWFAKSKMKDITHFISSSQYFTEEVVRKQYAFEGEVLSFGMPRNDTLIRHDATADQIAAIKRAVGVDEGAYIILYAPTYNELKNAHSEVIDFQLVKKATRERFGRDAVVLYRGHRYTHEHEEFDFDLDVSGYPDMRDLLLVTDMLITNYSSSIWDFSFTGRPCFLFTPDLKEYEEYRGFDKDIHQWGFPVCQTNAELEQSILSYDEAAFHAAMQKHHDDLGSFEDGNATRRVCEFIAAKIGVEMSR